MLAAAILASVVLYLVDKNHQWKNFWRICGSAAVLAALAFGGMYVDDRLEARKYARLHPTPDFIPATTEITPPPGFVIESPEQPQVKWDDAPKGKKPAKCVVNADPNDPLCIRGKNQSH